MRGLSPPHEPVWRAARRRRRGGRGLVHRATATHLERHAADGPRLLIDQPQGMRTRHGRPEHHRIRRTEVSVIEHPTEIAAALNQPLGAVKARIRRGMLQLRESLEVLLRKARNPTEV